jgi:hypothetical protein
VRVTRSPHTSVLGRGRRSGCRGGGAARDENRDQAEERQCNQVLIHCAKKTEAATAMDVSNRELLLTSRAHISARITYDEDLLFCFVGGEQPRSCRLCYRNHHDNDGATSDGRDNDPRPHSGRIAQDRRIPNRACSRKNRRRDHNLGTALNWVFRFAIARQAVDLA